MMSEFCVRDLRCSYMYVSHFYSLAIPADGPCFKVEVHDF